jgi:hypothetical protein
MSIVKIQGNASGTGTLTIAAPNTNSDRTLTLPDQTGTLLVGNGVAVTPSAQMYENTQTISTSYSITSGSSAMSAGPITLASGVVVTLPAGSRWVIV